MLDHVSFCVNHFQDSLHFYDETLALLNVERLMTFDTDGLQIAGYGVGHKPSFWIAGSSGADVTENIGKARGLHVAFQASTPAAIAAWHKKCLELGGTDNGLPGPRPEYHPGYYSAFIIDPNGWRIEAVLHHYETPKQKLGEHP